MRKKYLAILFTMTMTAAVALTGCGSTNTSSTSISSEGSSDTSSSESTPQPTVSAVPRQDENATYGKITKISGKTVTVELVTRSNEGKNFDKDSMPEGSERPEKPQGSGNPSGPEGSGKPSGVRPSDAPDGTGGRGMMGFESTGETKKIKVSDEIKIISAQRDGTTTDATIDDLATDTIVQLTMDGDDVTQIIIQNMGGGKMNQE